MLKKCSNAASDARKRLSDDGFSLIEVLVALVVLATAGVALMGTNQSSIWQITALEDRAAVQWAAEALLADLMLGSSGDERAPSEVFGRKIYFDINIRTTSDPNIEAITVVGSNAEDRSSQTAVSVTLVGFRLIATESREAK